VIVPGSRGGQNISVEQMREVRQDVARRPIMGRRKFYLVPSAEAMNEEAANTLLKTLEEPPPGVTLVLMATSPTRVLPTIRSRCQVVRFGLVRTDAIRTWLTEQGLSAAAAEELALTAGGRPGLALRWSREPEALARRRQVLELMSEVAPLRERARQRPAEALAALRLAERARALVGPDDSGSDAVPVVPAAASPSNPKSKIQNPKSDDESAPRSAKTGFLRLLEIARSYYRDLLLLAQGAPEELVCNGDALPALRRSAALYTPVELLSALEAMARCQQFLERNVQPQLALETLFLELTATNTTAAR
jgi:DNA polymerase-3 subunit delta'